MATKTPLPLWSGQLPPTVDAMRTQLGGRAPAEAFRRAGTAVISGPHVGVVLASEEAHDLVWTGEREVRRLPQSELHPFDGAPAGELVLRIAAVRAFASLSEGTAVRYRTPRGTWHVGHLVEKCRFGALVGREDGVVLGIGFASLQPADDALH